MNQYLSKIDSLLDIHALLKKLNKKELKFLTNCGLHKNCKTYRNLLSTLLKRAKEKYFTKFFNENIKNIKKTWIGIKSLVSLKHKATPHHHSIIHGQSRFETLKPIARKKNGEIIEVRESKQNCTNKKNFKN